MQLTNKEVRIETTNLCNAKCVICPREKMTRKQCTMPSRHFEYLVDQAKELGAEEISPFGYGEPLIDKNIVSHIEYCSDSGLDTFITSNGSLLYPTMCFNLIEAGLSHIRFSVHGTGEQYEAVHKNLKWVDTIGKIKTFLKANDKKGHPVRVSISFIPYGLYTDEDIERKINSWKLLGVDAIEVWKPHNWTTGRDYRDTNPKKRTCGRPERGPIQIQSDGKAIVCCFDFDGVLSVGNTYKQTLQEILKGDPYNEIRKCHETGDLSGLICETCDQLNEGDSPLIYSTVDERLEDGRTSSTKFRLL